MNRDKKRHKILEILSKQFLACEAGSERILGVKFEEITKYVGCDEKTLRELSSILYENKEIGYHDAHGVTGMYSKEAGVAAYSDRKYLRLAYKNKIDKVKDIIQIVIPIISLLIALAAIFFKVETFNRENEQKFKILEEKIKRLENKKSNKTRNVAQPPFQDIAGFSVAGRCGFTKKYYIGRANSAPLSSATS
ncbi:hypothetical protein [Flavobacterium caeni]|uniref:Uncharacterized protein n=1 Tax=Flavobacterium caeni TaxID=490189 RepID=A0A1G5KMB7_9FLAO|nr:hypothetical protein [Flavobacterium caeni]SCZ01732.1 hypothetical protein SAMN02927903_03384 [Flavobacterium caeni]